MSKKLKFIFLIFLFGSILFLPNKVLADTYGNEGDWEYSIYNNQLRITSYKGNKEEIVIPSKIAGHEVEIISYGAFKDCKSIKKVTISNTVTDIEGEAFSGCSLLKEIIIPYSVTQIGYETFEDCKNLERITIPNSVVNIGSNAFKGCIKLSDIKLPNSQIYLSDSIFDGCVSLTNIFIPSKISNFYNDVFDGCTNLKRIEVDAENKNFTSVDGVMYNKEKSKIVKYPPNKAGKEFNVSNDVTQIAYYAFKDNMNLEKINLTNKVTYIDSYAFKNCKKLSSITLSNNMTKISDNLFSNCENLESVQIPYSITTINNYAFMNCPKLKKLKIPSSVTTMGTNIFKGSNESLTIYALKGSYAEEYANDYGINCVNESENYTKNIADTRITYYDWEKIYTGKEISYEAYVYDINKQLVLNKDYKVEYKNNINSGTATIIIKGIGGYYTGEVKKEFKIERRNISNTSMRIESKKYTGKPVTNNVKIMLNDKTLVQNKDYKLEYKNNVNPGTATVIIKGIGNFTGSYTTNFQIYKDISKVSISTIKAQKYTGKKLTPKVTLKDGKTTLKKDVDYVILYENNTNVGNAIVLIIGTGKYTGMKISYFSINPKETTISNISEGSKKFSVKWKKITTQTDGYEIQYSTNSKFKTSKSVVINKNTSTSKTISKLKGKKKYYVRIRTYKEVNGIKFYSEWSKVRNITTKK